MSNSMAAVRSVRCLVALFAFVAASAPGRAQDATNPPSPPPSAAAPLVPLNPEKTVFLDAANKKLVLKTTLCLRNGVLEMLVCPKQTKEHESIVTIDARAEVIHAGLLAVGANPGRTVRYRPEYQPPTGQKIDIFLSWTDAEGKVQRRRAQELIRHATQRYFEAPLAAVPPSVLLGRGEATLRYDERNKVLLWYGGMTDAQRDGLLKMSSDADYQGAVKSLQEQGRSREMQATFVFAGSEFSKLEDGREVYLAQSGSLVCVANFPDAMIDVAENSSSSNDAGLLYEPWTERLPPLKTEVTVELIPVPEAP